MSISQRQEPYFPFARPGAEPPDEYAELRARGHPSPVRMLGDRRAYLVTRYADVREVLRSEHVSVDPRSAGFPVFDPFREMSSTGAAPRLPLADMDRPEHTPYRRAISPLLTAKAVGELESEIYRVVHAVLDDFVAAGPPGDLVTGFCADIPARVTCQLLGFPAAERQYFQALAEAALDPEVVDPQRHEVHVAMTEYITDKVAQEEALPGRRHNLLSGILAARDAGDIAEDVVIPLTSLMYLAGVDTTASSIALAVWGLLMHPDQADLVRQRRVDPGPATDELLRWSSIVVGMARVATGPLDVGGLAVQPGDGLVLALPAANHDAQAYEQPELLDLRRDAHSHLAFGQGIHQCPGQHLARSVVRVAVFELYQRLPGLRLAVDPSQVEFREWFTHGVRSLPVTW